jgi:hypothetical protein
MLHSERGPSKAHRYRKCPGSIAAELGLPDDSGIEAAQGQVFHEYADLCLSFGMDPQVFVGKPFDHYKFGTLFFDQEMADNMIYGLDYVRDLAAEPGAELYVEQQVNLERWLGPGEFGTSDVGVINRRKRKITIFDWKYGMIPVQPQWNDQEILYDLGFWNDTAEKQFNGVNPRDIAVDLVIEQPRAPGGGGVWETNMAVILAEGEKIKKDALATRQDDAPRIPGPKQCQFCKAAKAGRCPEYLEMQLESFDMRLAEVDELAELGVAPHMPLIVTPERRAYILQFAPVFERFLKDLHAKSYDAALQGKPDPGLKLVPGRTPGRKWRDEDKEKAMLTKRYGEEAWVKKLISPAQLEDKIGKKRFEETFKHHVREEEPKPILVPLSDRRAPVPNNLERFDAAMEDDLV